MRLSPAQLTTLFEGLDWTRVHVRRVRVPQGKVGDRWMLTL